LSRAHRRDLTSFYRAINSLFTYTPPGIVGTSFLFYVLARLLGRRQHNQNLWCWNATLPKVGTDRVGNYSDRHRLGARRVAPCLREARVRRSANPTNSGLFRACATCWKRHIACKLPHEEHQFSAIISETRFSHWRRPHASVITRRGPRRSECSYGCGHMTKKLRCCFQLSPRQRKHNLPDQLRAHPRSDRNGIA